MKDHVVYYELHVEDTTFYLHTLVKAESCSDALSRMKPQSSKVYTLQPKACLGTVEQVLADPKKVSLLHEIGGVVAKSEVKEDAHAPTV